MRRSRTPAFIAFFAAVSLALPAAADEPAPAPSPTPPGAASAGAKTVTVELVANDQHAALERRAGTTELSGLPFVDTSFGAVGQWEEACVAPCETRLDPRYAYRVAGDGLTPSRSFALPRDRDRVRLAADMGSSTGRLTGLALGAVGVGSALLGGAALVASPILESQDAGSKTFRTAVLAGGVALLATGVVEMGIGLYLWAINGSSVRTDHGVLSARAREAPRGPKLTARGVVF